jgi:hypothetical protein
MWVVLVVQIVLSIATLVALFTTVAWLQSSVREGRETKRLLEHLAALFNTRVEATPPGPSAPVPASLAQPRQGSSAPAPITLESLTEPQRRQALTIEMVRPTSEPPQPLAVNVGTEIVELDAETIARIEALKEDVNAGRTDGRLVQLLLEAGLAKAEHGDRASGEAPRAPAANDTDGPPRDSPDAAGTPTPPKKPPGK